MQKKSNFRTLLSYYGPYKRAFAADMFFAFLGAAVTLIIPIIARYITGTVINFEISEAVSTIVKLAIVMLVLVAIEMLSNFYITYYGHMMGARIERDMRNEIFTHYQKLSFAFFDSENVGHLMSRITNDLFDITELLHHGPEDIVISVIKLAGATIVLMFINPYLAGVGVIIVLIMLVYAIILNKKMKRAYAANRARIAEINSTIEDSLSGIKVVKSFGNEEKEIEKFKAGNERFVKSKSRAYRYMAIYNSGMNAFTLLITVISFIAGAFLMARGKLTTVDLVTFLLYISSFTDPVKKLVSFTEQFQNGYSGFVRFREMMNIEPDIVDSENAVEINDAKGNVVFEDVSFRYDNSTEDVLKDVNLSVKHGDYVALVGTSGAGKTTLCSLIPRFYDVTKGRILLDGRDIRDITLKSLRRQIGIVQQDVYLFSGNVLENIRYGRPDATDEEIVAAAKAANAHDFIMELPNGYETDIGQHGAKLSGGQKQRISIARVFLKDPPILIFDEATSALDNESERIVQHSLEDLAKDRTTFVIAHRLSTIRNARRILVLTEEGIAEEGTHDELIARGGIYAHLYNTQF